jgi:hypothetical protein
MMNGNTYTAIQSDLGSTLVAGTETAFSVSTVTTAILVPQ